MKKVLASFLSVVMSRISFVILTKRPETGGIRRKSKILEHRAWNHSLLTLADFLSESLKQWYPSQRGGRGEPKQQCLCCYVMRGQSRVESCSHLSRWKAAISALCRSKSEK